MKVLEIFRSYAQMTMKQFRQLPAPASIDEGIAHKWFEAAYTYSEERLIEKATPQMAAQWIRNRVTCDEVFFNEICILGEAMYQRRAQAV